MCSEETGGSEGLQGEGDNYPCSESNDGASDKRTGKGTNECNNKESEDFREINEHFNSIYSYWQENLCGSLHCKSK